MRLTTEMRLGHATLAALFGKRFDTLITVPILLLHAVMRERGVGVLDATAALCQSAVEQDPCGAVSQVLWLQAACVELVDGTSLGKPATLL